MEFYVDTSWKRGRRIVDVFHLANQMDCTKCKGLLDLRRTRKETRIGLASVLDILCSCGNLNSIYTDRRVKHEDEPDDYLVNTLVLSSKSNSLLKISQADLQHFLDMFCIPATLPSNAVTDSSTTSPATAAMTPSDISNTQTVPVTLGDSDTQSSGVFGSNPRRLHANDKQMSPSESRENVVESSAQEHALLGRGESIASVNTESSRELTLSSLSETSNDLPEEYFQLLKPELLYLEENDCFGQDSQQATELREIAEGVTLKLTVEQHEESPVENSPTLLSLAFRSSVPLVGNERDSHPEIKSEDTHCNADMTQSVSDTMTSDSASDEHVSVISDLPVAVSASGKTVPAQPVVRNKSNERNKSGSGSKPKYLTKRYAKDVPLEEMIGTCPVAKAIDEPGGSQSDGSQKRFECRVCDELFTSELEAYTHVGRHTGSPYLRCFRCGMEFKCKNRINNTNNLEVHLNKHDDVRPYVCEVCHKTYQSFRQHKQHMSYIHNYVCGAPAPFDSSLSCPECSYRAASHHKLTIHRRNHKKQRELKCNICGVVLSTPASLKHHKRRRHPKGAEEEYPFACEQCEERFHSRVSLRQHMRVHSEKDGAGQSGDSSSDPRHHSNHQHLSLSERAENLADRSEHEAEEREERITDAQNSRRLTLTSQTESSNDLGEEYFQELKPKLLDLVENDCSGQDSQHAIELSETAQVVKVQQHLDSPVKREDDDCNDDMTTFFNDVMTSDSVPDVHVPVSITDVSVAVSDSGKTVPAQSVVGKKLERTDKPGSKRKFLSKCDAQDVPLEEMIQTLSVEAASDEPGGSQSDTDSSQKRYECRVCDELFTSELEAYTHVGRHTGSPYLRCFRCGTEFKGKNRQNNINNLEVHLNQHDDVRPYVCEVCAKTFQSSRQHYQHMAYTHNYVCCAPAPQDSSLSCDQCSYRAASHAKLTIHRRQHKKQQELTCDICGAILSTPASLKHHKRRRHAGSADEYNDDMHSGDSSSDPRHHSHHQGMSLSEKAENLVESSENEATERGESIMNAQNRESGRHRTAKSKVNHSNGDMTTCVSDMMTTDSASDRQVVEGDGDEPVSASGKTVPAQPVVKRKGRFKCWSTGEYFFTPSAKDVPLEGMIETCPVAATSNEPGGSQSDSCKKQFQCRECDKRFTSELEAYCHVRRHTGSPYLRCFRCGVDFKGKEHRHNIMKLEAHLNGHDNLRPYVCEVCAKTFPTSRGLKQHMTEVHNYFHGTPPSQDSSLSCPQCSFKTHSKARLRHHNQQHQKQRELTCNICGAILSTPASLKRHKRCRHAGASSSDPRRHSHHQRMSLSKKAENLVESSENEATERGDSIMNAQNRESGRHRAVKSKDNHSNGDMTTCVSDMMTTDSASDRQVVVGDCDEPVSASGKTVPAQPVFKRKGRIKCWSTGEYYLKPSAQDVPLEGMIETCPVAATSDEPGGSQSDSCKKQFQCRECDTRFTSELEAYFHVRRHTGSPYLRCFRCGFDFKGKDYRHNVMNLEAHLNGHDNLRPYVCEVCAKTFPTSRGLKQHMSEVHNYFHGTPPSQDSSLSCPQCSFKTHSKARLRIHNRIHTTQRERICDVCGAILSNPVSLKHHKERMHEVGADDYSFACELCDKRFRVRSSLMNHLRWHKRGDVRSFQCQFCSKTFKKRTHLNMHERIHTGKKPHKCQLCEAAFVQKSSLDWHMKKHRAIE